MGNFRFAMTMLLREYKKSIFYTITLVFAIAVSFVFFNIINNEFLMDHGVVTGGASWQQVQVPVSTSLSFIIICFCCFMIFFANNFYISRKTSEIAIITLSGNSFIRSTLYLVYQTFTLLLIACPFGIGLGTLFVFGTNYLMYQYLGVSASIFMIPSTTFSQTLIVIAIILIILCVFASGYIYRNDIVSLLQQEKAMDFDDNRKIKIPSGLYVTLYCLGIVMMFMEEHRPTSYVIPTFVGIVGIVGMIKYLLPDLSIKIKDKYLLEKRYALIYVSNLSYSIRRSILLVALMSGSVTGMVAVIASSQGAVREFITGLIGYFVIVILLATSIVYKFCMEGQTRKHLFINMWKIGYTKKELVKIIKREVFYYYLILLLIPIVYVLVIALRFVYYGDMTLIAAILTISIYVVPISVCSLITYYNYKKTVIGGI